MKWMPRRQRQQPGEKTVARGVVEHDGSLGRLHRLAEAPHRMSLARAEAHGERIANRQRPGLLDERDLFAEVAAGPGVLRPTLVDPLEKQLAHDAFSTEAAPRI